MTRISGLAELIANLRAHAVRGDDYLRESRGGFLTESMIAGRRLGLDIVPIARDGLLALEGLERVSSRLRQMGLAALIRAGGVLGLLLVSRFALLLAVSEDVWSGWVALDRACGAIVMICVGLLIPWMRWVYTEFGWSRKYDEAVADWLRHYLVLGSCLEPGTEIGDEVRRVKISELKSGLDGRELRKSALLACVTRESERRRLALPKLAFLAVGIEWASFLGGGIGLALIPFLAWVETASGT